MGQGGGPDEQVGHGIPDLCDECCANEALTVITIRVRGREFDKALCAWHLEELLQFARPVEAATAGRRV